MFISHRSPITCEGAVNRTNDDDNMNNRRLAVCAHARACVYKWLCINSPLPLYPLFFLFMPHSCTEVVWEGSNWGNDRERLKLLVTLPQSHIVIGDRGKSGP